MNDAQKKYYHEMLNKGRGRMFVKDGHIAAVVTFLVGDDDKRFLKDRVPWTVIRDDPQGSTLYVDQLIVKSHAGYGCMHKEFVKFFEWAKDKFPNLKRAKWARVNAGFRKHGSTEGVKSNVYCKNFV